MRACVRAFPSSCGAWHVCVARRATRPARWATCARSTKKELDAYHREAVKQQEKIAGMEAAGADEHDIKKQVRVARGALWGGQGGAY